MGFFSWQTADTKESIMNHYSGQCKTVYLLQPGGAEPIEETAYDGYGVFGGVDAYEWLAEKNLTNEAYEAVLASGGVEAARMAGIAIDRNISSWITGLYKDTKTGVYCAYNQTPLVDFIAKKQGFDVVFFPGGYDTVIDGIGISANQLKEQGRLEGIDLSVCCKDEYIPLKFSFDKKAVYEDLPPSKECGNQGFFNADRRSC